MVVRHPHPQHLVELAIDNALGQGPLLREIGVCRSLVLSSSSTGAGCRDDRPRRDGKSSGAIVGYGYVATSRLLLAAGDEAFLHVADRTAGHVRDLTSQEPARCRVTLPGRLDTLTTPELDGALAPLLGSPEVTSLVFQVDALEYVSSAGIRCVIRAHRALADRGGQVAIVNPQPAVRRVFEIVKTLPPAQIVASAAEFDASLGVASGRI